MTKPKYVKYATEDPWKDRTLDVKARNSEC